LNFKKLFLVQTLTSRGAQSCHQSFP